MPPGGLGGPGDRRVFRLLRDLADVILVAAGTVRNEGYGYPRFAAERRARRLAAGRHAWPTFAVVSRRLDLDLGSSLFTDPPARTVVIAGFTLLYARTYPQQVAGMVLVDSPTPNVRALLSPAATVVAFAAQTAYVAGIPGARLSGFRTRRTTSRRRGPTWSSPRSARRWADRP